MESSSFLKRERERLSRCSLCCDRKRRERKALTIKGHRMSERERDKRGKRSITLLFFSLLRLWTSKKRFFSSSSFFSFSLPFFIFYYDEKVADARDYLTRISERSVSGMEGNRHSPKRRRRVFHWGTCVWPLFQTRQLKKIRPKRVFFLNVEKTVHFTRKYRGTVSSLLLYDLAPRYQQVVGSCTITRILSIN